MAWIYSRASEDLHLQLSHGSAPSRIVSKTDTANLFLCRGCNQLTLMKRPSGMTCGLCELRTSSNPSTSFTEASHARTSVLQDLALAWQESAADFSSNLSVLQEKLGRRLSSSKMSRQLELVDFEKSSEHLPIFGMTVAGRVSLPLRLEPRTLGKDGSYLPTPAACSYGSNRGGAAGRTGPERHSLETMARRNLWPTPHANCYTGSGHGPNKMGAPNLQTQVGGTLNPTWVEWLMGYRIEWTVCEDWAMQLFHSKPKSRSKDCVA